MTRHSQPAREPSSQAQGAGSVDADTFGTLVATYGPGHPLQGVGHAMAVVSAVTGVFILWSSTQDGPRANLNGNMWVLYASGLGALVLAAALWFLFRHLAAKGQTYQLFQKGISSHGPAGQFAAMYWDIEEWHESQYGNFAFRTSAQAPWITIGLRTRGRDDFRERMRLLHSEHRAGRLFYEMRTGEPVRFSYVDDKAAQVRNLAGPASREFPTFELTLDQRQLKIGQKAIDIGRIGDIGVNPITQKRTIINRDGTVFHTLHAQAITSFNVLQFMIIGIQQLADPQADGRGAR